MKKKLLIIFALLMLFPLSAWALTIPLDTAFSNYDPGDPGYNAHYGDVEITDIGDEVRFDISVDNSVSGPDADLQWFYFNSILEPLWADVSIVGDDIQGWSLDNTNTDLTHSPDGDGFFDFFVDFGSGGSPPLQNTSFTIAINGEDLGIDNFLQLSTGREEKGHYTVAAHIQSTSTAPGSEFVGGSPAPIPEPSIVFLLGPLLIGIGVIDRKITLLGA